LNTLDVQLKKLIQATKEAYANKRRTFGKIEKFDNEMWKQLKTITDSNTMKLAIKVFSIKPPQEKTPPKPLFGSKSKHIIQPSATTIPSTNKPATEQTMPSVGKIKPKPKFDEE
jgi:hypothetical protein